MALEISLANIASGAAGSFFIIRDNSEVPQITPSSTRRVFITNVPDGPVNNIVDINAQDFTKLKKLFGSIKRKDERDGNFSIRSCELGLENGDISVLNIRPFDDALDLAGKKAFSTASNLANDAVENVPYSSLFNTNKFWVVDDNKLADDSKDQVLYFANLGKRDLTIWVRKSNVSGFEQTIKQHYQELGQGDEIPEYLDQNTFVSEYMVDVFIFTTDFSDNTKNVANPNYGQFFDTNGLKSQFTNALGQSIDTMLALSQISESGFVAAFTGSLIPNFVSLNGNNLSIDVQVNSVVEETGILAHLSLDPLDDASDFTPGISNVSNGQKKPLPLDLWGDQLYNIDVNGDFDEVAYGNASLSMLSHEQQKLTIGTIDMDSETLADERIQIPALESIDDMATIKYVNAFALGTATALTPGPGFEYAPINEFEYLFYDDTEISVGDKFLGKTGNLVRLNQLTKVGDKIFIPGLHNTRVPLQGSNLGMVEGEVFPQDINGDFVYPPTHTNNPGALVEFDINGVPLDDVGGVAIPFPTISPVQLAQIKEDWGIAVQIFKATFEGELLNGWDGVNLTDTEATPQYTIELEDSSTIQTFPGFTLYKAIPHWTVPNNFTQTRLTAYKPREAQFLNGTSSRQTEILNYLLTPSIWKPLTDRRNFDVRYIVDCFKSYVEPNIKWQLASIAKKRLNTAVLANFPFMEDFQNSTDPLFRASSGSPFDATYIPKGGNPLIPSANRFSMAGPNQGDSYIFYFSALQANHYGRSISIPSAAAASNNFIQKHRVGNAFDIVANKTGIISGSNITGIEYPFDEDELNALDPFGMNPIIILPNRGITIYGNYTAKNSVITSLSNIHVRELVIFIIRQMTTILNDFVFDLNNPQTRLELKTRADGVFNNILDAGGLDTDADIVFENVVDIKNNNAEVRANRILLLDSRFTPASYAKHVVQRLFIEAPGIITDVEIQ